MDWLNENFTDWIVESRIHIVYVTIFYVSGTLHFVHIRLKCL